MKRRLFFLLALSCMLVRPAFGGSVVEIDGVWYEVVGYLRAVVTCPPDGSVYSGEVNINTSKINLGDPAEYYSVNGIDGKAFNNCNDVTIHVPSFIHYIIPSAFDGSQNVTVVPESLEQWCGMTFANVDGDRIIPSDYPLCAYINSIVIDGKELTDLVVPEGVSEVKANAFRAYQKLTSVVLPESVTTIGDGTFEGCEQLQNVVFQGSATTIGEGAFANGTALESVSLPVGLESIPKKAFEGCTGLKTVKLPQTLSTIGDYAFHGCTSMKTEGFPESLTYVGEFAFEGCQSLEGHLNVTSQLELGNYAFAKSGLTSVHIGHSIGKYGSDYYFLSCPQLQTVTFAPEVKELYGGIFKNCTSITSLVFPEGMEQIERRTYSSESVFPFDNCNGLKEITLPSTIINAEIGNCPNVERVNIHEMVYAFPKDIWDNGCLLYQNGQLVTDVVFQEGGQNYIRDGLFKNYKKLKSCTLPSTIESVAFSAFKGCDNMTSLTCYAEQPPRFYLASDMVDMASLITLYVPGNAIEAYKASETWGRFDHISPIPGTGEKCAAPAISYSEGKLTFSCDTEGAQFVSKITVDDAGLYDDSEIELSVTYDIMVYATATNHLNSDIVRAKLCWIDTNPQIDVVDEVAEVKALPVMIEHVNGTVTVKGLDNGQKVTVYSISGQMIGSATVHDGMASLWVGAQTGSPLLVKIGKQTVKVF